MLRSTLAQPKNQINFSKDRGGVECPQIEANRRKEKERICCSPSLILKEIEGQDPT